MLTSSTVRGSVVAIGVVLGLAVVGAAQPSWEEQDKLLTSDGGAGDLFGTSVSISGDYAIVGTPWDDDNGDRSGSAYVFRRGATAWIQQQKLRASDGAAGDQFGSSVSISGDYAIVGASWDDDSGADSGSAYVFKRDGTAWIQQQKLLASDGAAGDRFGYSVSISGDYAMVGARRGGAAYIFKRDGTAWIQQQKLLASDGAAGDEFGVSVSISGDYAIVGAPRDDDKGEDSGSAYIFNREGTAWTQQEKLLASTGAAEDQLGVSVSISGDYAIVGAPGRDDKGDMSGSAYIFKWCESPLIQGWLQAQKLLASDGAAGDTFGISVSISADYAIVGAYGDADNGDFSGSAYIFDSTASPIFRFWSPVNLRHFYTIRESEKNKLIASYSHVWTYEGPAYHAFPEISDPYLAPVYRFWSASLMAHFYTITESERNKLLNDYADVWTYEGPVFYAYSPGQVPFDAAAVYRFWSNSLGCHFYTTSERERDKLINNYSDVWTYEKIAWYAYP